MGESRSLELADRSRSLVVVIDMQGKLVDSVYRALAIRRGTLRLIELAALFDVPVLLTEQYPAGLGPTHPEVLSAFEAHPGPKKRLHKLTFGCCAEPRFLTALDELRPNDGSAARRQLIVCGIEAHVCVLQTVFELLERSEEVQLCWDCVSGRGEEYGRHAVARMQQAGAQITNLESVGFEWARTKEHPCFKAMSNLLKEGQTA